MASETAVLKQEVLAMVKWVVAEFASWPVRDPGMVDAPMPDDPCFLEQSDAEGIPRIWANLSWSDEGFFAAVQFTKPHQRAVGCWWVRVTGTHPDKPFLVEGIAPTGRRGVGEVHVGTIDPRKLEAGVSWHIAGGRSYAPSTG